MRQRFALVLAAGGRWPGADGGHNLPQFNWVKVDNKGAGAVDVSLNANPTAGDKVDTMLTVLPGVCRVFNVGGPKTGGEDDPSGSGSWPQELFLVSTAGTTVYLEIADHPIVDLVGSSQASSATPGFVRLEDGTSSTLGAVLAAQGDGIAMANSLAVLGYNFLWNSATSNWERVKRADSGTMLPAAGSHIGGLLVSAPANFSVASAPAAGTAASASQGSLGGGRNVCTNIAFGFSATTALGGISTATVNLRDGATGAGTVLKTWQFTLPAAVVPPQHVELSGLSEAGTGSTAMTLEFAAAVGNLMTYCNLGGYQVF